MNEKYLPIGSVVTLREATKKVMIIGYFPMSDDKKVFDYNACIYPEGIIDVNKTLAFNHEQIGSIDHMGLVNEESQTFNNGLKKMLESFVSLKDMDLPSVGQSSSSVQSLEQSQQEQVSSISTEPAVLENN